MYRRNDSIFAPQPDGRDEGQRTITATAAAYHAYGHVNTLGGAGAAYLATGDNAYLALLKNGYESLQDQIFATGGLGPDEQLLPKNEWLGKLQATPNSFETQCGSWAVFKLAKDLITCTGDASYGDWAERLYVNGIAASLPIASDGRVFYYSDYRPDGGVKRLHNDPWTCCTGTRPQAVAECADLIYFHDASNVAVNLFVPSTLHCTLGQGDVVIQQRTRFPESGTVEFSISTAKPARFGLRIRKPSWARSEIRVVLPRAQPRKTHPSAPVTGPKGPRLQRPLPECGRFRTA